MSRKLTRLRKLVAADGDAPASGKLMALRTAGICILIAILIGLAVTNPYILDDFIRSYREQYHLVVYGTKDYCSRSIHVNDFLTNVRERIHGQKDALDRIEMILRGNRNPTSIAIVGTTGVGKTHFINLIRNFYPWQDNVQHYIWSSHTVDKAEKYREISKFLGNLSGCGYNIILIDDLTLKDKDVVLEYQDLIDEILGESNRRINLIVFYVFSISRYTKLMEEDYSENLQGLQYLGNIKTVNFKELTDLDVEMCVRKMANDLDIRISDSRVSSILKSINIPLVGCKNVHAKVTKI